VWKEDGERRKNCLIHSAATGTPLQMEPNTHRVAKDERNVGGDLPDPRLNPMINPRLAKNLGRWANVYYTTPPGKREQAVLELLRELESAQTPEEGVKAPAPADNWREEQTATQEALRNPACRDGSAAQQRFCCLCGSPLKADTNGEAEQESSSMAPLPALLAIKGGRDGRRRLVKTHSVEIGVGREKRQSWKNVAFVLIISAAVGSWGLWRIRLDPAAPQTASKVGPTPQRITTPSFPNADVLKGEAGKVALAQSVRDSSKWPSKPAAGRPMECGVNHLENCSVDDLYRRTITLANGIDALFIDYDRRVTRLLRDATAHRSDSAQQGQNGSRQANYSAQLWERLQLGSYASSEKYAALKYRAELMRRAIVPKSGGRRLVTAYENPQSCLELHDIAEDLRRLAAKLRRPEIASPPSTHLAKSSSTITLTPGVP
jgi:hypothetical protein